jgi:RND family efflux transporter MFP subunit
VTFFGKTLGLAGAASVFRKFRPGKPALILLGALVLAVLMIASRPSKTPEPARERAWAVDVVSAQPATLRPTLELFGRVQSPQDAELSASVEAVIVEMLVRDGDSVEAGQALLRLDERDAALALAQTEADIKEATAQLSFAKLRLNRSKQAFNKEQELLAINQSRTDRANEIFAEGLLSRADMDTANENLARQQLAVNQAELTVEENSAKLIELEARIARLTALRDRAALDLERTNITAPFAGIISELQVSEGDRVRVGDTLMRLQNPESLEVRAQLPTRLARSISEGMEDGYEIPVIVEVEGQNVPGRVRRISGQTRAGSGGVDSFIGVSSGMAGLRLGSTVRVLLELPPEQNVIAIPGEAVYGRDRIYKLAEDRMTMVDIERVGERAYVDGRTEVLVRSPSLEEGDQIIVTKLANAAEGLRVQVNPQRVSGGNDSSTTAGNVPPQ